LQRTNFVNEKKGQPTDVIANAGNSGADPARNHILSLIPETEYKLIHSDLEHVSVPRDAILHEAGEKIEFTYFLTSGLVSLVVQTSDGRSVEVAVIGREGAIGAPLAFGLHRRPYRAIIQISGTALRIAAELLEEKLRKTPVLRRVLNRYVLVRGLQIAQIAACNRLHEIDQRLARWLLMCRDRVESDLLPITHELLAQMLGTGRPSVSLAAGVLQKAGVIETTRGAVRILNRRELESAACECYQAIEQFNRTLYHAPAEE
jgi:CRP-like cAMP-binding protein